MPLDFTLEKYEELCRALLEAGFVCIPLADYLKDHGAREASKIAVLRHDVDRMPQTALRMAQVEQRLAIRSSYYFRIPGSWNESIIREVASLGHEVGLHYEVLDKASGNQEQARVQMREDLAKFAGIARVETVAMHGNPLTPYDNRDFWKTNVLGDFGLLGEAYISADFEDLLYYSDTGRTWHKNRFNVFDQVPEGKRVAPGRLDAHTTGDLIRIASEEKRNLYILTHPERWAASLPGWVFSLGKDIAANLLKGPFKYYYASRSERSISKHG